MSLEHNINCSFQNEFINTNIKHAVPKMGDRPLLNRKIIRGIRVSILEHPYIVSIRRQVSHYLTGTLISKGLVLTVAHPLVDVPILELGVVMGQNYNDRGSILYTVIVVVFHEDFNRFTLQADLALIRVHELQNENLRFSVKNVRSIREDFSIESETHSAMVTGWGRCDVSGNELCLPRASNYYIDEYQDPMLRSINIDIIENSPHCDVYRKHDVSLLPGMLCVGPARASEHTCACLGVPGAPLVVDGALLGVLSWGFGCGYHTDLPLVYSDARFYQEWLRESIQKFYHLTTNHFAQIFETTKMAILTEWFNATTTKNIEHDHPNPEIQPWKIDKDLAMIRGDIYDIRDYFGGPEYHEEKIRRYTLIRANMFDEPRAVQFKRPLQEDVVAAPAEPQSSDDSSSDSDYYYYEELHKSVNTFVYNTTSTTETQVSEEEDF